jgi:fatty acid desaturase
MNNSVSRNNEHGQTLAAWVMTIFAIAGSALVALGIFLEITLVWQLGVLVITAGAIVSFVLHQLGYGQKPKS